MDVPVLLTKRELLLRDLSPLNGFGLDNWLMIFCSLDSSGWSWGFVESGSFVIIVSVAVVVLSSAVLVALSVSRLEVLFFRV